MMDSTAAWNGQDPNLSSAPQDEFQQLLEMGMSNYNDGLGFDFQDYGQNNGGGEAMDTRMDVDVRLLGHKDVMMQGQMPPMTTSGGHLTLAIAGAPIEHGHSSDSLELSALDAQIQYLQQQRQQHQQRQMQEQQRNFYAQSRMVPPTPNSIEMHSANNQFYPQSDPQHQAMYDRYQMRLKEQDVGSHGAYS
jgi:hypothetical protein